MRICGFGRRHRAVVLAGAEFDFESDFGADSDFGTGKASTSLRVPQATPALLRTCFSRSISAVAREIKPVP